MSSQVILYDLPSKAPNKAWSPNSWKTRAYLNFKQTPYKTEWIEYPDLEPTLSKKVAPNPPGSFASYTIPTVILPDGTCMQESLDIAKKLEQLYPTPALQIDTPVLEKLTSHIRQLMKPAEAEYIYHVPRRLLNERSKEWWYPDREKRMGSSLEELNKTKGGENTAKLVAPHVKAIGEMLRQTKGPFFEGERVSYADLVWASYLTFYKRIGDDVFDLLIREERDVHLGLLEACRGWFERDDH